MLNSKKQKALLIYINRAFLITINQLKLILNAAYSLLRVSFVHDDVMHDQVT